MNNSNKSLNNLRVNTTSKYAEQGNVLKMVKDSLNSSSTLVNNDLETFIDYYNNHTEEINNLFTLINGSNYMDMDKLYNLIRSKVGDNEWNSNCSIRDILQKILKIDLNSKHIPIGTRVLSMCSTKEQVQFSKQPENPSVNVSDNTQKLREIPIRVNEEKKIVTNDRIISQRLPCSNNKRSRSDENWRDVNYS